MARIVVGRWGEDEELRAMMRAALARSRRRRCVIATAWVVAGLISVAGLAAWLLRLLGR